MESIIINKDIIYRTLDDMIIILNQNGDIYRIEDPVGIFIWKCIEEKKSKSEIEKQILDVFLVSEDVMKRDLDEFLEQLKNEGIIFIK